MKVEESVAIDRSPEDVFAFFAERTNDPKWMGSVLESEWLDPGTAPRLGRVAA